MANYLGRPLELKPDRELRYCQHHTEKALHLIRCPDPIQEESDAWVLKLIQDNVLTFKGGWFVMGQGVFCNPRYSLSLTFFTNRGMVDEYLEEFSHAIFDIRVCKTFE